MWQLERIYYISGFVWLEVKILRTTGNEYVQVKLETKEIEKSLKRLYRSLLKTEFIFITVET